MTKEKIIECVENYGPDYAHVDYPDMLNTKVHGWHKSRYIASWANVGGKFNDDRFKKWLLSIEFDDGHMTMDEAKKIVNFVRGGKLEFESSAKEFLSK